VLPDKRSAIRWQGVSLVAITYVYFLIFAQFAFLKRLDKLGIAATHLQAVMAAMAAGGILASLLMPRLKLLSSPDLRLRAGLVGCGAAALFAYLPLNLAGAAAVSFLIGLALGLLTHCWRLELEPDLDTLFAICHSSFLRRSTSRH
jgi:uncharacterized membrane protein YeiH